MTRSDSPYIFDRYDDDDVPEELPTGDESETVPTETVIEDGEAMSYRSYQSRQDRLRRRELPPGEVE